MKSLWCSLLFAIVFSLTAFAQPARPAPIVYELACPAGYSPLPTYGKSFNSVTGQWRANICMSDTRDGKMLCQMTGCGASPAPPAGSLQGNNAGVFGGVPGSTIDFTNGLVSLAPTGTGVALKITGDSNSNDQLDFFNQGQASPGTKIFPNDTIGQVMTFTADNGSTLSMGGGSLSVSGIGGNGSSASFDFSGFNLMGRLKIDPDQAGLFNGVGLIIVADSDPTHDLQEWKDDPETSVLSYIDHNGAFHGQVVGGGSTPIPGGFFTSLDKWQTTGLINTVEPAVPSLGSYCMAVMVQLSATITVHKITLNVTTADASTYIVVAIYSADGQTRLIDAGAHAFDGTTTGVKTVTLSTPVTLPSGSYLISWNSNETNHSLKLNGTAIPTAIGYQEVLNANTTRYGYGSNSLSLGQDMPSSLGTLAPPTSESQNFSIPLILFE